MRELATALVFAASAAVSLLVPAAAGGTDVADGRVTLFARPLVLGWTQAATLYGAANGAGPQDLVVVQARECGSDVFRTYVEAHVAPGGGWSTDAATGVTTSFRAVWGGNVSNTVTIRQGANIVLAPRRSGVGFTVSVSARRSLWRKRVVVERRLRGRWRPVKTVVLSDSLHNAGFVSASQATFRLAVPKGTQLRAVLPLAQAKPCYVRSISRVIRT